MSSDGAVEHGPPSQGRLRGEGRRPRSRRLPTTTKCPALKAGHFLRSSAGRRSHRAELGQAICDCRNLLELMNSASRRDPKSASRTLEIGVVLHELIEGRLERHGVVARSASQSAGRLETDPAGHVGRQARISSHLGMPRAVVELIDLVENSAHELGDLVVAREFSGHDRATSSDLLPTVDTVCPCGMSAGLLVVELDRQVSGEHRTQVVVWAGWRSSKRQKMDVLVLGHLRPPPPAGRPRG